MKKGIIKSVIISLSIVLVSLFLTYLLIALFSPMSLGNAYFNMGEKKLSVKYTEIAYEKDPSFSNLTTLVDRCISLEDDELIIKYGEILLNDDRYSTKLFTKSNVYLITTATNISFSLYNLNKKEKAIDYAFTYTSSFKLDDKSPIKYLISYCKINNDTETLNNIITKLNNLGNEDAKNLALAINNL